MDQCMSTYTRHKSPPLFSFLISGTCWCCTWNQLADHIRCVAPNKEQDYDTVLTIQTSHTPCSDRLIKSNDRTTDKSNLCIMSTHFYYAGFSEFTKVKLANAVCSHNSASLLIWHHTHPIHHRTVPFSYTFRPKSLTLHTANLHLKLQLDFTITNILHNLIIFITASLILQRSEPETNKMHIFPFPHCNKQCHRQHTEIFMPCINH